MRSGGSTRIAAARLVPFDELSEVVTRCCEICGGVTAADIAEEFGISEHLAAVAMEQGMRRGSVSDMQQGPGWWLASDGKWYPPNRPGQTPPVYRQGYQPPPKKGMSGCLLAFLIVLGVVVALFIIGLIATAAEMSSEDGDDSRAASDTRAGNDDGDDEGATRPSATDQVAQGESDEVDDVAVADCRAEQFTGMVAVLEVTNNSPDPSSYFIDVAFENPAGTRQFGTGFAIVQQLRNGQSTTVDAESFTDAPPGRFKCVVVGVERTAS